MIKSKPLQEIVCAGSHYSMGLAQGERLRRDQDDFFNALLDNDIVPFWLKRAGPKLLKSLLTMKGLEVRWRHLPNIRKYARAQMERMEGIAEGSGFGLNLMLGLSSIETMAAHFHFVLGCSSLGIDCRRSQSGLPLLAYNHDFPASFRDHLLVRRSRPADGLRSLQLTYPSMPGAICGVNSEGLALSINHAFTTEPFNNGVPPTFMLQQALDTCRVVEEVKKLFKATRFSCGSVVTAVDEKGDIYVFELARRRFGVRKAVEGLSLALNQYQVATLQEIEIPQEAHFHPKKFPKAFHGIPIHRNNWERRAHFERLLKQKEKFSPSDLRKFLADHDGKKKGDLGTICRHHPTGDTIGTAILYPRARVLEAARGFACGGEYQRFTL